MSKKIKKVISFAMALLVLFSTIIISSNAIGTEIVGYSNYDDQISLCWNNVVSSTVTLGFTDEGKIEGVIRIFGSVGTKYKDGTIKIDRYTGSSWVNVKTWSNQSATTKNFNFTTNTLSAVSGVKYRLTIEITAYNGSLTDSISLSKTSTN